MAIDWSGMLKEMAPVLGNAAGQAFGLFNDDWKNPADSAMPYLNRIPQEAGKQYQPYINAAQGALPQMQGQYSQLLNDPSQKLNQIGQGYQESPGLQFAIQKALQASNSASAAGGMAGSPANREQDISLATGYANKDYNDWLNHALGLYGQGLHGEENIYGVGANASNNMADLISQALAKQGETAYNAQQAENIHGASNQGLFNTLGSLVGTALPFLF